MAPHQTSPWVTSHSFVKYPVLLIYICIISTCLATLTTPEKAALQQIYENHPDLSSVASWAVLDRNGTYFGRSWNGSFEGLCAVDGYDIYGVFCQDGHVGGLYVTKHWGKPIRSDFSLSSGLTYLTNYTDTNPRCWERELIVNLAQNKPLENVQLAGELVNFSIPNSIQSLSGVLKSAYLFSEMTSLRSLKVEILNSGNAGDMSSLCGLGLEELSVSAVNVEIQFSSLVNCLTSLQRASYKSNLAGNSTNFIESESLKVLSVEANSLFQINCSMLEDLSINSVPLTPDLTLPNLRRLNYHGTFLPSSFDSFFHLESFSWSYGHTELPLLSFAPNLTEISLAYTTISNTNLTELWISIPSTIRSLSLIDVRTADKTEPVRFPSDWKSLRVFNLYGDFNHAIYTPSILDFESLEELYYLGEPLGDVEILYRFRNLKKLDLTWLGSCEVPPDFFQRMPQLTHANLYGLECTGAFPWYGLENLESLSISSSFTAWPSILGSASRLKFLKVASSKSGIIPTDEYFLAANLSSLVELELYSSSVRPMELPSFWSQLPSIEKVILYGYAFQGPVTFPIAAPRLAELMITRTSLCDSLPNFQISTHLDTLAVLRNSFSGTIPDSWEDNLSILRMASLAYNSLSGTIPPHWLDHHGGDYYGLSGNNFTGPLWNMSRRAPSFIDVQNTGVDICAQDPTIQEAPNSIRCDFNFLPKCPNECPQYWSACSFDHIMTNCSTRRYSFPPEMICKRVNESCPLPKPGIGFECNRGRWIYLGDHSTSISLPKDIGSVFVFGNLSTNGTIIFSGTGTTIEIEGCVNDPSQIVVELEIDSTDTPGQMTLINQRGLRCDTDLAKIPVILVAPEDNCKKWRVGSASSSHSLTVTVSMENACLSPSSQLRIWITLGSALGGIFGIALSLGILYSKSIGFRTLVRTCDIKKALVVKESTCQSILAQANSSAKSVRFTSDLYVTQ